MKKIFTTTAIVIGTFVSLFAQTKGNLDFGANVGLNIAYINSTGYGNLNSPSTVGLNLGASLEYYFSDTWSIKGKLIYDQKGWDEVSFLPVSYNSEAVTVSINTKLDYITIPIMADWHFGRRKNWYLNFGPYVGYLLNASENNNNVKSNYQNTDAGFAAGIGVKFRLTDKIKLFIEEEGEAGIMNILKNSTDGTTVQNDRSGMNIGIIVPLR